MLEITHDSGFFSCCSQKLHDIVKYINIKKIFPVILDCKKQFSLYKQETQINQDITSEYFEPINHNNDYVNNEYFDFHWLYQFIDYKKLDYNKLSPLINKYFSINDNIKNIISFIEDKYKLDYNETCVLFYRGNDKMTETTLCGYDDMIKKANTIKNINPNIQFLIQSDETEFINIMLLTFPNSIVFYDEIRHMHKIKSSVDIVCKKLYNMNIVNFEYSKKYLAITVIMSRCKYVVCGSGNCSLWIALYRNNADNIYQFLENKWL
jgi:hypothetical protein